MLYSKNRQQLLKSLDKKHVDLSKAKEMDCELISDLIENTSFIETLVLPKMNNQNAEDVMNMLDKSTAKNTTLTEIKLDLHESNASLPANISVLYKQIQSRLRRNSKRIFAIHGGGNIGMGCMADIVARSPYNYSIIATSSDHFSNALINNANRYCLQNNVTGKTTACIQNVTMLYSRDQQNILKLYTQASLLALCLTEEAFLQVAEHIAQGLIARYEYDAAELKMLILMNKPNCDQFVREKITKEILKNTTNANYAAKILRKVKFIPTVVDRIVTKISRKEIMDQMRQQLIAINRLHSTKFLYHYDFVDKSRLFNQQYDLLLTNPEKLARAMIAFNLHFALFKVEQNFSLHVPDILPEAKRMPILKPVKNINQFAAIKNKYINGPHAILAWLGGLSGCETVADAIKQENIKEFIEKLMDDEIAPILKSEYPTITSDDLRILKDSFLKRCADSTDDPILRVARDPLRKINSGGRIRGLLELCEKNQLDLMTPKLECGIAAGILYAIKNIDPNNTECNKIREIYQQTNSYEAILCYKGHYGDGKYPGFDPEKDKKIIYNILKQITSLEINCKNYGLNS